MYIKTSLDIYNTYMCYTISFLSRNIDLEINFFHIYLKCSAEKVKEKNEFRFQLCDDRLVLYVLYDDVLFYFFRRRLLGEKSSVTPILAFANLNKMDGKGSERKRKSLGISAISGERGSCCFWQREKNMSYGWIQLVRANFFSAFTSEKKKKVHRLRKVLFLDGCEKVKWKGKWMNWALENDFQQVREMFINTRNV